MRIIYTFLFTSLMLTSLGQTYSGEFENQPITEAFEEIEEQSKVTFFYAQEWLDSLFVSRSFENASISEVLDSVLKDTDLNFYRTENKFILLKNARVIENPNIVQNFRKAQNQVAAEKGLIFSREYLGEPAENQESQVYEIGDKDLLQPGGTSTLAGYIKDQKDEPIEGALVYLAEPFISTVSDASGFFSINLPNGKSEILIQFVGMKPAKRNVVLFSPGRIDISLDEEVIALQEITVSANADQNVTNVQMGLQKINVESVKNVPVLLGERDILKIATTLPGVQTVGEGAAGFNVRGGKSDQNLFLVNNATVYNTSHFFGFFSVFNSDAVQNMDLYKGSIPAKYGGRLSSVFDIQIKEANNQKFSGKGSVSPITSSLTLEIPLKKEQTSLLIGGRTTYSNWVLRNVGNDSFKENEVSFGDIVTQIDHEFNENNRVTISAYASEDKFNILSDTLFSFSDYSFRNFNSSITWNHDYSIDFSQKSYATFTHYDYELGFDESEPNAFVQDFSIKDWNIGTDFKYYFNDINALEFGLSTKRYGINPGRKLPSGANSIVSPIRINEESGLESQLYLSGTYDILPEFSIYGGLRYVLFNSFGPADVFGYESDSPKNNDSRIDTTSYAQGEIIKTYGSPEIRISGKYGLNPKTSFKFSYNKTRQYIHTLTNSASLSPTDIWRLSNNHILPQAANQFSVGLFRNMFGNHLETSFEAYYKFLQNILDFKVGADFLLNPVVETAVLQGNGKSYGLELSLKKSGDFNGWLSYTFSRAFIQLDGTGQEEIINNGAFYPTSFDKPHNFNLVSNYKLTRRFSLSFNVTYQSGRPVTYPIATYQFKGIQNIHYSDRNEFRIPHYFRVDTGLNIEGNHKIKKLAHSFWSISIYNLTGRDNPYSVFFDVRDGKVNGYQLVVFGNAIPTISYNFKF